MERCKKSSAMNKLAPIFIVLVVFSPTSALAKSNVAGGYDTGFARGAEEARTAINQFDKGCPLADKQDDYCDGWKDGWEKTVVKELD
jgi:hypothetical protein